MPRRRSTDEHWYTARLRQLEGAGWRRLLPLQAPYRWSLRRLDPGFVLDVGCGLGRNLAHVDGHGVGVDHNPHSVAEARRRGFVALTPDGFADSEYARTGRFDSLLLSHVVEHMTYREAATLLSGYLPYLRQGGRVIVIAPQEAGYRSDETHVEFFDESRIARLLASHDLRLAGIRSFPLPRPFGRAFRYNEFVAVGEKA